MKFSLFGSPRLEVAGQMISMGRRKAIALLTYLVVTNQPHSRAALATLLWPDSERSRALTSLRQTVKVIKKLCGPDILTICRDRISWSPDAPVSVDVLEFQNCLAAVLSPVPEETPTTDELMSAVDLYQGDFLADFVLPDAEEFEAWRQQQADHLQHGLVTLLAQLIQQLRRDDRPTRAIHYAQHWVSLDPLHEPAQQALLELYVETGQRATAIAHYEQFARQVKVQCGLPPTLSLSDLLAETAVSPTHLSPAHPTTPQPVDNLPTPLTPLIGRSQTVTDLAERLMTPGCTLLTVTGPGGIGKTRLALAAARQVESHFSHGVCFVPLIGIKLQSCLLGAIAQAVRLPTNNDEVCQEHLLNYLRPQQLLLLLDNFEQLTTLAPFLADILQAAPRVKLLVTSRHRLGLKEEWLFPLTGLDYRDEETDFDKLPAVQLFRQTLQRIRPNYPLTEADRPAIKQICQAVEGLPLGLELAAAAMRVHSCQEVARAVAGRQPQLPVTWENLPDRHTSLKAVCTYSWQLLSQSEKQTVQLLALFPIGFDREAGAYVGGVTADQLMALVDKSLLRCTQTEDGRCRFDFHPVIRRYALEQLALEPDLLRAARIRYAHYYATFLQEREQGLQNRQQKEHLAAIQAELLNIRQAWHWAGLYGQTTAIDKAVAALFLFYDLIGFFRQGVADLTEVIDQWRESDLIGAAEPCSLFSRLLIRQGLLFCRLNHLDEAEASLFAGLSQLLPEAESTAEMRYEKALSLKGFGHIALARKQLKAAQTWYEQSLALLQNSGRHWDVAHLYASLGNVACQLGQHTEALHFDKESLAIYEMLDNPLGVATSLNNMSHHAELLGDYGQAEKWLQKSLQIAQSINACWLVAVILSNLAHIASLQEEKDRAKQYLHKSLHLREREALPGQAITRRALLV